MRWGWFVLLWAGCHDRPGLLVEVKTTTEAGPHHVQLYVSKLGCGSDCPSIIPPATGSATRSPVSGTGWLVEDDQKFTVDLDGAGLAKFLVEPDATGDAMIARVLAVDVDAAGQPLGASSFGPIRVPGSQPSAVEIVLSPADAFGAATGNEHLLRWERRSPPAPNSDDCVVVQHGGGKSEFFVPTADHDCDSLASECDAFGYLVDTPPRKLSDGNCTALAFGGSCKIGGAPCVESLAVPPLPSCVPLVAPGYCLPHVICNTSAPCQTWDPACLRGKFFNAGPTVPRLECILQLDALTNKPCGNGMGPVDASMTVLDSPTSSCKSLQLGTMDAPPSFDSSAILGSLTVELSGFQQVGCTAAMTLTGTATPGGDLAGMAEIVTETGVHRVIPWLISLRQSDCATIVTAPIICTSQVGGTADSLYTCQ
ncbi:MAG: hypothetical protein JWO36_4489 [Myxococcales bacterium]|nr:hypothetical protein [Myxococcales bacterium]